MARKNRRRDVSEAQPSGGFVPASLDTTYSPHGSGSSLGSEEQIGAQHGSASFAQYSRNTANYSNRRSPRSSNRSKIVVGVIIVVLLAGVIGLGVFIYKEMQKQTINEELHSMSRDDMEAVDAELTPMMTFEEPFTVLLLGSDERTGDEEDIGARTDTIVLCRIDPTQNIITMVSIPRDTMVQLSGVGTAKINAAFTYGGPGGTIVAVKDLCGVEINHYAEVNFDGLVGLIDAIGGIDVYVDETIDDPDAGDIVIPEGEQHLNGEAALVFSRSRAYVDGDFTRVSNQRKVIEAIVHRGLEAPATELYGIIQASTAFLTTDSGMDVDFIYSLADQIRHNNDYPVQLFSATIPASTTMLDGVSYVVADTNGVSEMMDVFMAGGDVSELVAPAASDASELSEVGGSSAASGSGYSSGYDTGYGSAYGTGTDYGTGTNYGTGADYGTGTDYGYNGSYDSGYYGYESASGTGYGTGYDTSYDTGYGTGSGTGYDTGYGTGYGGTSATG